MEKNRRLYKKSCLILLGLLLLVFLVWRGWQEIGQDTAERTLIQKGETEALVAAISENSVEGDKTEFLQYIEYWNIIEQLDKQGKLVISESEKTGIRPTDYVPREVWYETYRAFLRIYDMEEQIQERKITLIAAAPSIIREDESVPEAGTMLGSDGVEYTDGSWEQQASLFHPLQVFLKDNQILAVYQAEKSEKLVLENAYIVGTEETTLTAFYEHHRFQLPMESSKKLSVETGQIADVFLMDTGVQQIICKNQLISGKVLKIDKQAKTITLENEGTFQTDKAFKVYKTYGTLQEIGMSDIVIGYQFTDFVRVDGKVCAALVTRNEKMEKIRVLLKDSEYAGIYHKEVCVEADEPYEIQWENQILSCNAGEKVEIGKIKKWKTGDRIYVKPQVLSAKIRIPTMTRSMGIPAYRGVLEIERCAEGYRIINELLLEEYLYAVVPSEMPASYPEEALAAQAVCARTYAYKSMLHAGCMEYGAHVDDSTAYQVYHNIDEEQETTEAVKRTSGMIVCYEGEPAGTYYYSTSCGYGTNASIWNDTELTKYPYLQARKISADEKNQTKAQEKNQGENSSLLCDEATFEAYIKNRNEADYEAEESWYRWSYRIPDLQTDRLTERLRQRYRNNPALVLTKVAEDTYESKDIPDLGGVKKLYVQKRNEGGVIQELIIETEKLTVKVITEYNIRYILSDGCTKIQRQDGSESGPSELLPSAFLMIEPEYENDYITGYVIHGGGYGHGVGMSQNAAKEMAAVGDTYGEILNFFYDGTHITQIYEAK